MSRQVRFCAAKVDGAVENLDEKQGSLGRVKGEDSGCL